MSLENAKLSTYAVLKLLRKPLSAIPKNKVLEGKLIDGTNGTCFFISDTHFITANHVLNSQTFKDSYCFLHNEAATHNEIKIVYENKSLDLTIGITKNPVSNFFSIREDNINTNSTVQCFGYSKAKTKKATSEIIDNGKGIKLLSLNINPELISGPIIDVHFIESSNPLISSDGLIELKKCNITIVNKEISIGFSGGGFFDEKCNIIGLQSMIIYVGEEEIPCGAVVDIRDAISDWSK